MKHIMIIALMLVLMFTPLAALGEKPTVLIIASYHKEYLWQSNYQEGIIEKLGADYQVDIFEMDTKRLPKSEYKKRAQLAWEHYEKVQPQLVFLGDDNALRYLAPKFADTETPVVYLGINNNPKKYGASDKKNITGVLERPLYNQSVKMLQALLNQKPRNVLFLFDDGVTTRAVVSMTFRNKTKLRIHGVPVQVKRVGTLKRWQETVLSAKEDRFDAIVTGGYNTIKDEQDNHVPIVQVGQWTSAHTPVPMFSFWSFSVAADQTIGGLVLFGKSQGEKAGELALRILKEGVSPGEIRPAVSEGTRREEEVFMSQLVFIHGPGAGGCAEGFRLQLDHFPGSLAPTLPGHLAGAPCDSVKAYTDWLRGWLWAQGHTQNLVLVGFTLGACVALQYGLDYPEEVQGLVLMTVAMRSKQRAPEMLDFRLRAAEDPVVHEQWLAMMGDIMHFIEPDFREQLIACHRQVGPRSQYHDLVVIDQFDVQDRIAGLQPPLVLIRGMDDPLAPEEYEREIHEAVPGSQYIRLSQAGHFPMAERPAAVNEAIQTFVETLV